MLTEFFTVFFTPMKTKKNFLALAAAMFVALCAAPSHAWSESGSTQSQQNALDWSQYIGYEWTLLEYGLYQDGRCVNRFVPCKANGNENESVRTYDTKSSKSMFWENTGDGDFTYEYKINGSYIYLYHENGEQASWLCLKRVETVTVGSEKYYKLFTVDKFDTYRYFLVDNVSIMDELYMEYLFGF